MGECTEGDCRGYGVLERVTISHCYVREFSEISNWGNTTLWTQGLYTTGAGTLRVTANNSEPIA
jgi:hypothetical protein